MRKDNKTVSVVYMICLKALLNYQKAGRKLLLFLFALLCLLLPSGCAGTRSTASNNERELNKNPGGGRSSNPLRASHVVFIGLDGWGGAYVPKAEMPTVKRMMARGASSLDVRCIMPSNSWPNWTTLFNGTPPDSRETEDFPAIFTLVKNRWGRDASVLFHEWSELQKICPDEIAEKIRIVSDPESAGKIASYIRERKPVFTAVSFNGPDGAGHNKRWGSRAYYDKLAEMDTLISIIERAVIDAGIYDETVFVLSADHGGVLWGHGFNSSRQRKIPLVIYGKAIKEGYEISPRQSISCIAPTMAVILGLELPPEWKGQPLMEVFK